MTKMETHSTSDAPAVDDPTKPNLARAVDMVRDKRSGEMRPRKGKGGRPRKGEGRKAKPSPEPEDDGPAEVTPEDERDAGFLGGVLWRIVGTFTKNRPLTPEEQSELGPPLARVMAKYLPDLTEYAPEISLVVVVWGLFERTKVSVEDYPADDSQLDLPFDASGSHGQ
jgi:hypothetical protein